VSVDIDENKRMLFEIWTICPQARQTR